MSFWKSSFLFDDREDLVFGEVTCDELEFVQMVEVLRRAHQQVKKAVFGATVVAVVGLSGGVAYKTAVVGSSPAKAHIKSHPVSTDQEVGDELRQKFVENRKFLGLKQNEVANLLGLSCSTIEKFEQEVYVTPSLKTKEAVKLFNEWTDVLQESHGNRPFIVRPFLKIKMNALGDRTPMEYAGEKNLVGIRHLISLERLING